MRVPTVIAPDGSSGCTACNAAISIMPIIAGVESTGGRRGSNAAIVHSCGTTRCTEDSRPMRGIPATGACEIAERFAFFAGALRLRGFTRRFIASLRRFSVAGRSWCATSPTDDRARIKEAAREFRDGDAQLSPQPALKAAIILRAAEDVANQTAKCREIVHQLHHARADGAAQKISAKNFS